MPNVLPSMPDFHADKSRLHFLGDVPDVLPGGSAVNGPGLHQNHDPSAPGQHPFRNVLSGHVQ